MGLSADFRHQRTAIQSLVIAILLVFGWPDVGVAAPPTLTPPDLNLLQWNLHNVGQTGGTVDADIDAPEAWAITTGSSDVVIAVIDSGIDVGHEEFVGRLWINPNETRNGRDDDGNGYIDDIHGWHFTSEGLGNGDISDNYGHGSAVASIIAAETGGNSGGMAGICWNCRLMILKVGDQEPDGDIERAIRYAIAKRANVINLSLGSPLADVDLTVESIQRREAIQRAVADAVASGIVVVAAIGNDNVDHPDFPSRLQEAVAVGATDRNDTRWKTDDGLGSNFGPALDLMAPGEELSIVAAGQGNVYFYFGRTSAATPHVAGAVALLLSLDGNLAPEDVREALVTTTDTSINPNVEPGTTAEPDFYYIGAGRLNLFKALSRVAFSDVKFRDWFNPYVAHAFQEEVINGFSDWTFHPADPATRAEVLRMAYAAAGESITIQNPTSSGFADVHSSDWFFRLVADAGQKSYVQGELCDFPSTAPCFFPDRSVNRAEALKIISTLFKVNPSNIEPVSNVPPSLRPTFPDVSPSDWFYPYVRWMSSAELNSQRLPSGIKSPERLVGGYPDGFFRPGNLVNRAEMAKIVVNTMLYCRTGPNPRNCNTSMVSLNSPATATLTAAAPVSIGAYYEQPIDRLNQNAPAPFHLLGGDEQIVTAPIPLSGSARDADGDLLFYFWSASGGSFTSSDPVNFSSVTWRPPAVTEDTLFTVDVVRGDRRGLVGRGSFRFLVPGTGSNSPGSGTITGPNGAQTGAVTLSATASDSNGLARVFITFTPTGPAVALCGTGAAAACSGTSGTWSRSGVNPASYGASAGTVTLSLFVEDSAGDVRFVDSHSFTFSPPSSGPTFRLTVQKQGDGSGTVSGNDLVCGPGCTSTSLNLPEGTDVTLAGTAAAGSVFVGFGGEICYGVDPCSFRLLRDRTVRATFGLPDAFALRFTKPANGDTGVATTAQVNAYFNRDIVAGPNYGSIALRESGGTPVPFTPVVSSTYDGLLVLIPSSSLVAGRSYVVSIPAGAVSDTQGTPLATPVSFTFTVAVAGAPKMYIAAYPTTVMEGDETKVSLWFETPAAQERTIQLTSTPAGELIHPSEVIVPAGEVLVELQVDTRRNSASTSPVTATLSASESSVGQQSLPIVIANTTSTTGNSLKFQAAGIVSDEDGDGVLEAGEEGDIRFDVANFGSSTIFNVRLDFAVLNTPYLKILGGAGGFYCELGALAPGRNGNCTKRVGAEEELPTGDYFIEVRGTSSGNGILDQARIPIVNRFVPDFTISAGTFPSADLQPGLIVDLRYTPRNGTDGFSEALPLFEVTIDIEGTERLLYRTYANARGYLWNDQFFRLPIVVPPVPGIHAIRARINPPGSGRLTESNYTNNDASVLYLHVAAPNQAPVLSHIPSPLAAKAGQALTFTVSAVDANNDPVTYRLGPAAPAGATLNSTSGVFSWTPPCNQGPASHIFTVIAADDESAEDVETVTVEVGLEADLHVAHIQSSELAVAGERVGYTILVSNTGPSCITGATLLDTFPAALTSVQWTCTATPGSSCTASGNGSISDSSVSLLVGGGANYVVSATLSDFAQGVVVNTATAIVPASATDPDSTDDSFSTSITLRGLDFGDAPELGATWRFPTALAGNGARHGVHPGLRLGDAIDAETDGQESIGANGDDSAGSSDEDGVTLATPLVPCQTAQVQVTASAPGNLFVWIDFNTDGDWADTGEWVVGQQALAAGINEVSFPVPCGATPGGTAIGRFRFSSAGGLSSSGLALDGEVEDHVLPIAQVFHRLTVVRSGPGSGTLTASPGGIDCGLDCVEDYPAGSVITLAATAAPGSLFNGWTGAGCAGNALCIVTLDQAKQVTAVFGPFQSEVFRDGFESGTVSGWSGTEPP